MALLLRSVLFVPGSSAKALAKARTLAAADGLLLDLEDAVAPSAKAAARALVVEAVRAGFLAGAAVTVRVNGAGTPWHRDDLEAVAAVASCLHGVCLPKVESAAPLADARAVLRHHGGAAAERLPLWAMVETPRGVARASAWAEQGARRHGLACLVAGTSDLTKELRARHTRDRAPLVTALSMVVLAARAAGVAALDGVHLDLADADGALAEACAQGRALGFDGKTLIHPGQIAVANAAFGPSPAEVELATRLVQAHADATARGAGVVVVDGRLVEGLHVQEARVVLALHAAVFARATQQLAAPAPAPVTPGCDDAYHYR